MKKLIENKWEEILSLLETQYELSNIVINTWIRTLKIFDVKDNTIYFYDINNINFPQSFTQLNSINASFNSTKPGKFPWAGIYNATTSSIARIRLFNYYNSNDNAGDINIIAIGKLK